MNFKVTPIKSGNMTVKLTFDPTQISRNTREATEHYHNSFTREFASIQKNYMPIDKGKLVKSLEIIKEGKLNAYMTWTANKKAGSYPNGFYYGRLRYYDNGKNPHTVRWTEVAWEKEGLQIMNKYSEKYARYIMRKEGF